MKKKHMIDLLDEINNILTHSEYFYCIDSISMNSSQPILKCNKREHDPRLIIEGNSIYGVDILEWSELDGFDYDTDTHLDLSAQFRLATQEEIDSFESLIVMEEMR